MKGFVIMTASFCGPIIADYTEEEKITKIPHIYEDDKEAWKKIVDTMITEFNQFMNEERELEDTEFVNTDWVEPVEISDRGVIVTEEGKTIFHPKIGKL